MECKPHIFALSNDAGRRGGHGVGRTGATGVGFEYKGVVGSAMHSNTRRIHFNTDIIAEGLCFNVRSPEFGPGVTDTYTCVLEGREPVI